MPSHMLLPAFEKTLSLNGASAILLSQRGVHACDGSQQGLICSMRDFIDHHLKPSFTKTMYMLLCSLASS